MGARKYPSPARSASQPVNGQAKVLILDIETAPILGNVWSIWQQNVGLNQIERDWYILSFGAKWLGQDKVIYYDQSRAAEIEDDTVLLGKLWKLLDEADIMVAHNGKQFDAKKINARFILAGMSPPSPYKVVDTLLIAKAQFKFTSNKLEYLADKLNTKYKKLSHAKYPGFSLWKGVMAGDKAAWAEMRTYNEHDVLSLEELYLILRPWDRKHPNVDVYDDTHEGTACPVCGSHHLQKRGWHTTNVGKYQRYACNGCGAWSHARTPVNTKGKRRGLLAT
jgi:hypothetical protein